MSAWTQDKRTFSLNTPLGKDALIPVSVTASEGLSRLFHFRIEALALPATTISFDQLLGKLVTINLYRVKPDGTLEGSPARYFNGLCHRVSHGPTDGDVTSITLEVVPRLWLLSRRTNSRIFQQTGVTDIIKKILDDHKIDNSLLATARPPRDYCVQYRETDLNFVSRLMEEEGIFYFFEHSDGAHKLIIADANGAFKPLPQANLELQPHTAGNVQLPRILTWNKQQVMRSGSVALFDSAFGDPAKNFPGAGKPPGTVQAGTVSHTLAGTEEIFDYPGEYAQRYDESLPAGGDNVSASMPKITKDADVVAGVRIQQEVVDAVTINATSNLSGMVAGWRFTVGLVGTDPSGKKIGAAGEYILTAVHYTLQQPAPHLSNRGNFMLDNSFECIPSTVVYRPHRLTPKPVVQGVQTAIVVGPNGEEAPASQDIFTDKYGRVKVHFYWSRPGKTSASSSCWVRVGSIWAGKQWGAIHIPRIGQEVIVAFQEGDPDQPIITGSVYNATQMPPYDLPANATQSGIKSRSANQGGAEDFNELRFEDKKGQEDIYFHGQKDFHRFIEHDDDLVVKHDQTAKIEGKRTEILTGDETLTIKEGNRLETIKTGNDTLVIETGNRSETLKTGNDTLVLSMGNMSVELKMGNQSTKLGLGAATTEAMQSITLKVGQSSIVIDQMGVKIKGMMVSMEGQLQTEVKGLMTSITGSAMLKMGGGITMIG